MVNHELREHRRPRVTVVWVAIIALAAILLAVPARAHAPDDSTDRSERSEARASVTDRPLALDGGRSS